MISAEQLLSTPFIFIIFGVIVVLISLFGLCGAITRNSCMVLTVSYSFVFDECWNFWDVNQKNLFQFSNLLIILLACQLGVGIYGSIRQDQANDVWDQIFNETLNKRELHRETWDVMQPTVSILNVAIAINLNRLNWVLPYFLQLQCCGVYGPEDWTKINQQLPDSCCQIHRQDVSCDIGDAFKIGCKAALFDFFQSHYIILASVLLSVFVIQVNK